MALPTRWKERYRRIPRKSRNGRQNEFRVFFDLETYNTTIHEDSETLPYLVGWTDQVAINRERNSVYISRDLGDFYEYLRHVCGVYESVHLYAHNSPFDVPIALEQFLKYAKPTKWEVMKLTPDGSAMASSYADTNGVRFTAHCTLTWCKNMSLKEFAKLHHPKLYNGDLIDYGKHAAKWTLRGLEYTDIDGDQQIADSSTEYDYLRKDVILLYKYFNNIEETKRALQKLTRTTYNDIKPLLDGMPEQERKDIIKLRLSLQYTTTISSYGKKLLDIYTRIKLGKTYNELFKPPTADEWEADIYKISICGGLTLYNKNRPYAEYKNCRYIKEYDINSAYPHAMQSPGFCYGSPQDSPDGLTNPVKWYEFTVPNQSEWVDEFSFLSNSPWAKERWGRICIMPADYVDLIDSLDKHKTRINKILWTESGAILADYVNELYNKRQEIKGSDRIGADAIKLLLNSAYGKMAERPHSIHHIIEYDEPNGCYKRVKREENPGEYYRNISGIYITCATRTKLLKAIIAETRNGNTFLYCDTDSIKLIERNPVTLDIDDKRLGAWKYEGNAFLFATNGMRKKYVTATIKDGQIKTNVKVSGVSRSFGKALGRLSIDNLKKLFDINHSPHLVNAKTYSTFHKGKLTIRTMPVFIFNGTRKPVGWVFFYDKKTGNIEVKDYGEAKT